MDKHYLLKLLSSDNDIIKEIITDFVKEYSHYKPERVEAYDIFQQVVKSKLAYIDGQNNSAFEILSFYKTDYKTDTYKKKGFLGFSKNVEYMRGENIIIDKNSKDFNHVFYNRDNYRIYSILRKSDNTIFTIGDKTEYRVLCETKYRYDYGEIGSFNLDGEFYMGSFELKSNSGIQVFYGGGMFIDIEDINLIK